MSDVQRVNISLLPAGPVENATRNLARELPSYGQVFNVGESGRLPHLTLYMTMMPSAGLAALEERLCHLAADWKPIHLRSKGVFVSRGNYVEIEYRSMQSLRALQMRIIKSVRDLRDRTTAGRSDHAVVPDAQKALLNKFGYDLIGEYFRPHITLAKYHMQPELESIDFDDTGFDYTTRTLSICIADEYGSARNCVSEINID